MENLDFINYYVPSDNDYFDLVSGLKDRDQKKLNSKYFYDKKGSELFEKITKLSEYYPTKKELEILNKKNYDLKKNLPSNSVVVEFGSGSTKKIKKLLEILNKPEEYISIDISKDFLFDNAKKLANCYPDLKITAICADFSQTLKLSKIMNKKKSIIGFFPGSTIGNFNPINAKKLLKRFSKIIGSENYLLVGVDLKKNKEIIEKAYNDKEGITAQFNKNILLRINKKYGTKFNLENFSHKAFFNSKEDRIEMHLLSKKKQNIKILNQEILIKKGETIHTEVSYKYSIKAFKSLAKNSGFNIVDVLTDNQKYFGIFILRVANN